MFFDPGPRNLTLVLSARRPCGAQRRPRREPGFGRVTAANHADRAVVVRPACTLTGRRRRHRHRTCHTELWYTSAPVVLHPSVKMYIYKRSQRLPKGEGETYIFKIRHSFAVSISLSIVCRDLHTVFFLPFTFAAAYMRRRKLPRHVLILRVCQCGSSSNFSNRRFGKGFLN